MHPASALQALECINFNTAPTDSTWKCTRITMSVKTRSSDHELSLLHVDSQPLALHALLSGLQLWQTLFQRLSCNCKVISIQEHPWHTCAELVWRRFQYQDEEEGTEDRSLMYTNSYTKLLAILPIYTLDSLHWCTCLGWQAQSTLPNIGF